MHKAQKKKREERRKNKKGDWRLAIKKVLTREVDDDEREYKRDDVRRTANQQRKGPSFDVFLTYSLLRKITHARMRRPRSCLLSVMCCAFSNINKLFFSFRFFLFVLDIVESMKSQTMDYQRKGERKKKEHNGSISCQ
jgi:hypothetical protein